MIETVRNKFILNVKRFYHKLGFMIERVPNENTIFADLVECDESVKRYVLKRVTSNIGIANNHNLYNKILKKYVPDWTYDFSSAKFVGRGLGEYSLNTFRKVGFENRYYFEKIYFNNSFDLQRIEWFYKFIHPHLKDTVNVAEVYQIVRGDLLTIVYFDFANLVPLSNLTLYRESVTMCKRLLELSNKDSIKNLAEQAPDFLTNFRLHAYYRGNISLAAEMMVRLSSNRLSPQIVEELISLQPIVLTHGDIQKTNLFDNNFLVDWDSVGFFPLGLECAYILFKSNFQLGGNEAFFTFDDLQNVLSDSYKTNDIDNWKAFELSVFYFYFIFIAKEICTPINKKLQNEVLHRIDRLYDEVKEELMKG